MNLLSKAVVMIGLLLAICSLGFGLYTLDLLIIVIGVLFTLFSILFALESKHILNNPFRK